MIPVPDDKGRVHHIEVATWRRCKLARVVLGWTDRRRECPQDGLSAAFQARMARGWRTGACSPFAPPEPF